MFEKTVMFTVLFGDTLQFHTFKPWMSAVPVSAETLSVSSDWWRLKETTSSQRNCSLNNPRAPSAARGNSWKCLESKEQVVTPENCLKRLLMSAIRTWLDDSNVSTTSKRGLVSWQYLNYSSRAAKPTCNQSDCLLGKVFSSSDDTCFMWPCNTRP